MHAEHGILYLKIETITVIACQTLVLGLFQFQIIRDFVAMFDFALPCYSTVHGSGRVRVSRMIWKWNHTPNVR
jgi:hypothetical protein